MFSSPIKKSSRNPLGFCHLNKFPSRSLSFNMHTVQFTCRIIPSDGAKYSWVSMNPVLYLPPLYRVLEVLIRKIKTVIFNREWFYDADSSLLMFLWCSVNRCPILLHVYVWSVYFDHHSPLKPSISKEQKQNSTLNSMNNTEKFRIQWGKIFRIKERLSIRRQNYLSLNNHTIGVVCCFYFQ